MKTTLVVAHFNEDIEWTLGVADMAVAIYGKGEKPPDVFRQLRNVGREANTYLHHIVSTYGHDDSDTIFCQGDPFTHCPNFLAEIAEPERVTFGNVMDCTIGGAYDELSLVHEYCRIFGLPVLPKYPFVAGAQFRVTAEQVRSHPLNFYKALRALTLIDPLAPYTLERLWLTIFNIAHP